MFLFYLLSIRRNFGQTITKKSTTVVIYIYLQIIIVIINYMNDTHLVQKTIIFKSMNQLIVG